MSRFTRTLGTLVSSGVSILEGLEITAKTAGNQVVHDAVMESRQSIAGGETIAAPLEKSKVFPPMVISMIAVGEQTGGLDEMLSKIADFYDEEVDVAVSALREPHGARDDRAPGRDRRRHGDRDVPADLRHDERGAVGRCGTADRATPAHRAGPACFQARRDRYRTPNPASPSSTRCSSTGRSPGRQRRARCASR